MKLSDKGGLTIDRLAHTLIEFNPSVNVNGTTYRDGCMAFYHEERLYSVRNIEKGNVGLVYANSPYEAIDKVMGGERNGQETKRDNQ